VERRGLEVLIVSLRHPTDGRAHPVHGEIRAPLLYLPEYLLLEPWRVFHAWLRERKNPRYRETRNLWLRDLMRDPTPNRIRRFGQALVLASELPGDVLRLHAHFLHTPASVTRYAALLRGLPWTGSAHAKDIWTTPEWEKREKLASCDWLVTCTAANHAHLAALAPPGRVELVYHGLDLSRFADFERRQEENKGDDPAHPVVILSVGRLVEKKGTDVLLESLARLPAGKHWRFVHAGGGPLREALARRARALGIAERVEWRGPCTQTELLEAYRAAKQHGEDMRLILVMPATFAEDVKAIEVSTGVLSCEGGFSAHASVVARQYGKELERPWGFFLMQHDRYSQRWSDYLAKARDLFQTYHEELAWLVTHRLPIKDAGKAFTLYEHHEENILKVILDAQVWE